MSPTRDFLWWGYIYTPLIIGDYRGFPGNTGPKKKISPTFERGV